MEVDRVTSIVTVSSDVDTLRAKVGAENLGCLCQDRSDLSLGGDREVRQLDRVGRFGSHHQVSGHETADTVIDAPVWRLVHDHFFWRNELHSSLWQNYKGTVCIIRQPKKGPVCIRHAPMARPTCLACGDLNTFPSCTTVAAVSTYRLPKSGHRAAKGLRTPWPPC